MILFRDFLNIQVIKISVTLSVLFFFFFSKMGGVLIWIFNAHTN